MRRCGRDLRRVRRSPAGRSLAANYGQRDRPAQTEPETKCVDCHMIRFRYGLRDGLSLEQWSRVVDEVFRALLTLM